MVGYLEAGSAPAGARAPAALSTPPSPATHVPGPESNRAEDVVPMSLLRRKIAQRLVQAKQDAALLTRENLQVLLQG